MDSYDIERHQTISFDTKKEECHKDLHNMIDILMRNDYIAVVRYEDYGIVSVDFNDADKSWGGSYPYWLTPEEEETVIYENRKELEEDSFDYQSEREEDE